MNSNESNTRESVSSPEHVEMRRHAVAMAQEAGKTLKENYESSSLLREEKGDKTFVTEVDRASERLIVEMIKKNYPHHGILGEEGSNVNPEAEYQWIIDPLDGTTNFTNGIPIFAVSIGLVQSGVPVVGVVFNPSTNSLFEASKDGGTFYNGQPVHVSKHLPQKSMLTFECGYKEEKVADAVYVKSGDYFRSTRVLGGTALELALLSRGGLGAFICLGLEKWDYAAGALLVQEAGGTVTDVDGNDWTIEANHFVASNGVCHDAALALVQESLKSVAS